MNWPLDIVSELILASQSPARRDLLEAQRILVHTHPTHTDETCRESDPILFPLLLAKRKMRSFLASQPRPTLPVITCDTIIAQSGEILGKPRDYDEATGFLRRFADTAHEVISAYSLLYQGRIFSGYEVCEVIFHPLSPHDISTYLSRIDYSSCAGAYRIQDQIIPLVKEIQGNFSTVVGLPLEQISDIVLSPDSFESEEYPPHGEK
ncbi:MAG: septum formation protein Maf [Sphaerochaetaceae bacterium]|nr:septum formation protein Maf [Sphaerochaetaceae bacterium]